MLPLGSDESNLALRGARTTMSSTALSTPDKKPWSLRVRYPAVFSASGEGRFAGRFSVLEGTEMASRNVLVLRRKLNPVMLCAYNFILVT